MSDEIKDLDDVEAQAWALCLAGAPYSDSKLCATYADECIRMLRERRAKAARTHTGTSTWDTSAHGRSAERARIATWLRNLSDLDQWAPDVGILLDLAVSIERGEHHQ